MTVEILAGDIQSPGTWRSFERVTGSTATAFRVLSDDDVSFLGMGTATGDNSNNLYSLTSTTTDGGVEGDAVEGQWKLLFATATGEAAVFIEMPTQGRLPLQLAFQSNPTATALDALLASATGNWVFQSDGDFMLLRQINGTWNYVAGAGATIATAT